MGGDWAGLQLFCRVVNRHNITDTSFVQAAEGWDVTGLGFSRVGPGLIRHDLTDKEATLLLIRTIRPHLGNSRVSLKGTVA